MPENVVSVTRPGKYGNPFKVGDRVEDESVPNGYWFINETDCLEIFEHYARGQLLDNPNWLEPLRGKDLACFCKPDAKCHADVLLRLLEETPTPAAR